MPRISASSVAEHRANQERAIMDATFALLHEKGVPPTLAQVAQRAGLSRTSIYQYYKSPQELLRAAAREVYPRWIARVTAAVDNAATPQQAVLAYANACVDQVAEGGHAVGTALASFAPDGPLDDQAEQMHASARLPLLNALEQLHLDDPDAIADLVMSVIHAAGHMADQGIDLDTVHNHLATMLGHIGTKH
ncbi:TetR/AcrR family transcriptional regulator [Glutamicibacter sp. MNS18]|uniref:TetR/AcrR family transcriptional regulator n=1 Tax=Glutamicibacter sp. MNS18 TaxID=2989817 RepID=UPI0022358904|nr:TetR/AcrR family transcriptional regulator [Glutamicibacter sp. MNS18]MCW4467212.1 TetR/AcrR family transcriptional regulator [Glutamicibacter sp. MNS18]